MHRMLTDLPLFCWPHKTADISRVVTVSFQMNIIRQIIKRLAVLRAGDITGPLQFDRKSSIFP